MLEFKGPSVSPRIGQLDLLIEVGLGIDRRLNSERLREKLRPLAPRAVSFWYLGNRLGKRFLDQANERLKGLAPYRQGVWRSEVLQRPVFLVSRLDLPIEQDTLPLHVVGQEPRETELAVARFLLEHPALWRQYRAWLAALHVSTWQEVRVMARTKGEELTLDLRPLIKTMGKQEFIRQLDARGVLEDLGKELLRKVGIHQFVKQLDAAERQELRRILLEEDA